MARTRLNPKYDDRLSFEQRRAFAHRLQRRMDALDLSQSELGRRLDTDQSTVNRWLNPARGFSLPEAHILMRLPRALECSYKWLLTGEGDPLPEGTSNSDAFRDGARTAYAEVQALVAGRLEGMKLGVNLVDRGPVAASEVKAEAYRQQIGPKLTRSSIDEMAPKPRRR
jgi:transcriptional regulator with XRE-family HTH domain